MKDKPFKAAPGPRPGTIYAYQCTITPDCFHWEQVTIPAASELGKLLRSGAGI